MKDLLTCDDMTKVAKFVTISVPTLDNVCRGGEGVT